MRKMKVAVIGLGFAGKQHVEALRRIPGVEIIAASDENKRMGRWCEDNGIPRFYEDHRHMLETEKPEVVHNCTPNHLHYPISRDILEAGCHVYSEKPLTLTAAEGEELIRLAERKGKRTAVNFNYRNHLMVREMRERFLEGRMGELSHIQAEYLQDWLLYPTDFDWRIQREKGGTSRAVADIGSHCFDTIQYITGQKIVSVYAKFHRQYETRMFSRETETFASGEGSAQGAKAVRVENEDAAIILFRLENGMVGSVNVTQVCAGKKNGLKVLLSGTKESAEWSQEQPDKLFTGHRDHGNEILYAGKNNLSPAVREYADLPDGHPVGWKDALVSGFKEFYASLIYEKQGRFRPDFADGCRISMITEACVKSDQSDEWVSISDPGIENM